MESRVIIRHELNLPPQDEIDNAIKELGNGWRIVSANTAITVFKGAREGFAQEVNLSLFVTTVALQKD